MAPEATATTESGVIDVYYNCGERALRVPLDAYWVGDKNVKLKLEGDTEGLFEVHQQHA